MDIKQLLREMGFHFNKQFGQNFLTDEHLLNNICSDAEVSGGVVLEIGAGAGTLTRVLSSHADKVVAFEIDRNLERVLAVTLADCPNVKLVLGDVMKYKMPDIEALCGNDYRVVANIPYYLTSPLIMRFVEEAKGVTSLTLTVQKEVAERLAASPKGKDYGAITVGVQAVADVEIKRILPRALFYPQPNVDSAVVHIAFRRDKFDIPNPTLFRKTVRVAFAMRRKTLVNNLAVGFMFSGMTKQIAEQILVECNLSVNCRGEELSVAQFVELYKAIERWLDSRPKYVSVCIWGNGPGRPHDNLYTMKAVNYNDSVLSLEFDRGEKCRIVNPQNAKFGDKYIHIGKANTVVWSHYYYGKEQTEENLIVEKYDMQEGDAVHFVAEGPFADDKIINVNGKVAVDIIGDVETNELLAELKELLKNK